MKTIKFAFALLLLFIATGCEKERMEGTLIIKMVS